MHSLETINIHDYLPLMWIPGVTEFSRRRLNRRKIDSELSEYK